MCVFPHHCSQQRHSSLWRRKSRDQKRAGQEDGGEEGKPEEEEDEEDEEESDEGLEDEDEESLDEKDSGGPEEKHISEEDVEVFEEPGAPAGNPVIEVSEPEKVSSAASAQLLLHRS